MPGRRCKTVVALKTEWVLGFKHSVAKRKQKEKKKLNLSELPIAKPQKSEIKFNAEFFF